MSQIFEIFTENRKPTYSISSYYDTDSRTLFVSAVAGSDAGMMNQIHFEIKTLLDYEYLVEMVRKFLEEPEKVSDKNKKILRQCIRSNF